MFTIVISIEHKKAHGCVLVHVRPYGKERNETQMFAQKFSLFSTVIVLLVYIADIYQEDFVCACARSLARSFVYLCVGMVTNSTFEKDIYL